MKIYKHEYDSLSRLIGQEKEGENLELELIFQNVKLNDYQKMKSYLNQPQFKIIEESRMLRILPDKTDNIRITINNEDGIQYYCKNNNLLDGTYIIEQKQKIGNVDFNDLRVRVNLKQETETEYPVASLNTSMKRYRLIERTSYISNDRTFRFDISCVRSDMKKSRSFLNSKVLLNPKHYEIEIEILKNDLDTRDIIKQLMKYISHYNFVVTEFRHILRKKQADDIMKKYLDVIGITNYRNFWIGPKPVSLEHKHLDKDSDINILQNYCVTEKADGLRCLLFIDDIGDMYAINTNGNIYPLKINITDSDYYNSVFDTEYIFKNKEGKRLEIYAIFDMYYKKGESIMNKPFVSTNRAIQTRHTEFKDFKITKNTLQIRPKTFSFTPRADKIWSACKSVLDNIDNDVYEYFTDGIILQPMDLVVGGSIKNNEIPKNTGKTWSSVFKWKPPEDNSIDFLVKLDKRSYTKQFDERSGETKYVAKCILYVAGYKDNACQMIYKDITRGTIDEVPFQPQNPSLNDSAIMNLYVSSKSAYPTTLEDEYIENNTVVECRYDIDKKEGFKWVPMRIRYDKTADYNSRNKKLSMNFVNTANSIWELTHTPITKRMISTGENFLKESDVVELGLETGAYYNRSGARTESRMIRLQQFHNKIIKKDMMIKKYLKEGMSLLDLACGKGGDLYKWIDMKPSWVLGVDINKYNIYNDKDGFCVRYNSIKQKKDNIPDMASVVCDSSKPIYDLDSYTIELDKTIIDHVYNGNISGNNAMLERLANKAQERFDVIEMMFAIHYLMINKETFDSFIDNVLRNIKPGGIFMFNSLNGKKVHNLLKDKTIYRARNHDDDESTQSLWEIEKHYDLEDVLPDDETCFGKKISVYIESINNKIDEYLVNYEYLETYLNGKGFEKVEELDFRNIHMTNDYQRKYAMTDLEKGYSYLHTMAVYRKTI